jgi:hypothetical protein
MFFRNIKPKQILLKENKIEIPDMFGDKNSTFYYSDINGAIYMATEKNGYIRELFIKRIWMKIKSEYLELFEFLNDKKIYK